FIVVGGVRGAAVYSLSFFFSRFGAPADLHSFPTRRSSDLLAVRLVDELAALGMDQIVLVSAAPASAGPHALVSAPVALRTRMGEIVRSFEAAAATEAAVAARSRGIPLVVVRPDRNPVGPFDFEGVYDERSDGGRTVAELLQLGYADAYHHLIEPMVAAAETPDALA